MTGALRICPTQRWHQIWLQSLTVYSIYKNFNRYRKRGRKESFEPVAALNDARRCDLSSLRSPKKERSRHVIKDRESQCAYGHGAGVANA